MAVAEWQLVISDLELSQRTLRLYRVRRALADSYGVEMPFNGSIRENTRLYTITVALWWSTVVSFCRCFSKKQRRHRLKAIEVFSLAQLVTYEKFHALRNKTITHSISAADAVGYGVLKKNFKIGVANRVLVPADRSDLPERLEGLIIAAIQAARRHLTAAEMLDAGR